MKRGWMLLMLVGLLLAVPVMAQDDSVGNRISFNGVSFSFGAAVAEGVLAVSTVGTPAEAPDVPGGPVPNATQFTFTGTITAPEPYTLGRDVLTVFPTADFAQYPEESSSNQELAALQTLLADQPDLAGVTELPLLPPPQGSQLMIVGAEYIESDTLAGVRYLTVVRLDVSPLMEGEVQYVFQGQTKDGAHIVSLQYSVLTGVLPTQPDPALDITAFEAGWNDYVAGLTEQLGGLEADAFTPSLAVLDDVVRSISIEG